MTTDAIYSDPRPAAVYDAANPATHDDAFYRGLAGMPPSRVLDLGCGTGRLAVAFAADGHEVTGLDPSEPMLEVARARPGADAVDWRLGEAATLGDADRFDLIVMTGNVFQVFLTDDDIRTVLAAARAHLVPGGRLAFETRNAVAREWEEWTADDVDVVEVPGVGTVEIAYRWTVATMPLVTFETIHRFPDGVETVSPSTLRFVTRDELGGSLTEAGFEQVTWLGDGGGRLVADSREFVVVAS